MAGVRREEAVKFVERDALSAVKLVDSPAQAARARLQIEVVFRRAIEAAEKASASGVLPEAGKVWFRGQISMMWEEVRDRLRAGDGSRLATVVDEGGVEHEGVLVRFREVTAE